MVSKFLMALTLLCCSGMAQESTSSSQSTRPPLSKKQAFLDTELRDWQKGLKKRCPGCRLYLTIGKMGNLKSLVPSVFLLVRDPNASEMYVGRFETQVGNNVVVITVPGAIVDAELLKIVKGDDDVHR